VNQIAEPTPTPIAAAIPSPWLAPASAEPTITTQAMSVAGLRRISASPSRKPPQNQPRPTSAAPPAPAGSTGCARTVRMP